MHLCGTLDRRCDYSASIISEVLLPVSTSQSLLPHTPEEFQMNTAPSANPLPAPPRPSHRVTGDPMIESGIQKVQFSKKKKKRFKLKNLLIHQSYIFIYL